MKKLLVGCLTILSLCVIISTKVMAGDNALVMEKFRNCQKYSETSTSQANGMNINYKMNILGWVNDKCVVNMEAKVLVNSPEAGNMTFTPRVKCEFTKSQLDELIQKESASNEEIKDLVMSHNYCSVEGLDNMNNFAVTNE